MTLRSVVEPLAALERGPGSPGERQAAEMLAEMFGRAGAPHVQVDEERFRGPNYARILLPLGAIGLVGSLLVAAGRRVLGGLLAAGSAAAIIDDVENGRRPWRRLVARPLPTWNVVAQCGDLDAERTLVVLAHHDAAPTGRMFDPSGQRAIAERWPQLIAMRDTGFPIWWPVVAGPLLGAAGALLGRRRLARAGAAVSALMTAAGADIARHRIVPGANDNLSGSAALVALAERVAGEPLVGLRLVLASCGSEEALQGGIYGFVERHLRGLDPARTWVLNLDTVGSPELILVEGEGAFAMHDFDRGLADRVAAVAERATGEPLRRGVRARASSDSIVPSRAGYPTAMLASWEPDTKLIPNYHLPSDVPENLEWETIERAVGVAEALARDLSGGAQDLEP